MNKPNCYKCKYRRNIAGSCHSSCVHPSLEKIMGDPFIQMLGILATPANLNNKELNIKANPHGIRNRWFQFPMNFDPVWLDNCDGFENKLNEVKND